ncbi:MAG: mechanosensitive ion channel [Gammaproteobacteria bacterium]|nr:mechanosensitive ion channel [Gammaproteobacteria bacterium]
MLVYRKIVVNLLLLLCAGLASAPALAQSAATAGTGVTVEILQGRIQEVEASAEVTEVNKGLLLDLYRKSISLIKQRQAHGASASELVELRESAPKQSQVLRAEIKKLESRSDPELQAEMMKQTLSQLEQQFLAEKTVLSGLGANLAEIAALLEAQSLRVVQVRERLDQARRRQTEIADEINTPSKPGQSQRLAEARLWALQLETRALKVEIEMLNQELLSQPVRVELYNAQGKKASLEWDRQQKYVELIGVLVTDRRVSDAETAQQAAEETERQAFGKHPLVQGLAQQNTLLSNELNELAARVEATRYDQTTVTEQIKRFSADFRLTRQKLEIAGLSQALGQALLRQRNTLPRAKDFRAAEKRRRQQVVESSLRQIQNQQERSSVSNVEAYLDGMLQHLSASWQTWLREELRELTIQRRDLLDQAINADGSLQQALSELDVAQRELSKVVSDYNRLMDERLLWVRTGDPPSWEILTSIGPELAMFAVPQNWVDLGQALFKPRAFPWMLVAGLLMFAVLLKLRPALRASLRRSGRKVGQLRHDRFYHSIRGLIETLLLALPLPVLFVTLGLHLQLPQGIGEIEIDTHLYQVADWSGQFAPSIGTGFFQIALYTFYFVAFRVFCEPRGLAVAHFHWSLSSTRLLRRETARLMLVFLPVVFLIATIVTYQPAALAGGLSRLLICIITVSLAWFFGRILSPNDGAMGNFYRANPANLLSWFRYLWLALGHLLPLLLAGMAITGYVYTATRLGALVMGTLWLLVAIILIYQLVVRWVVLLERQLEFKDALERHRAQRATEEGDAGTTDTVEEPEIDFGALGEDTKKLISSILIVVSAIGMWAIWSPALPAFRILDEVSLWSYTSTVEGVAQTVPVTLGNVTTGLLIIVLGTIAALRLPALMEIALFARFNFTAGSRYAIAKLTQYLIISIGIVMVFSVLGGRWGEIQWLVAALGVGIGFGLQEIIANFISGLILLFERPVRIGDIVTVGETSGVVTKIHIRSTTIRNWDQQELLVPNKEFVTGRLLNWTLSDPVARIVISVGVAYGSDVTKALQILLASAEQHERVIEDPPPLVTFESFGDSALEIKLRCYIGSMDYRLLTMSELNQTINREMEAAGIVIAFPQRDIHLDTSTPLDVHIHQGPAEPQQG